MIVFGSRGSELARAQTELVARTVAARHGEPYRIEIIETRGDRELAVPLASIGGKGVFTAELEEALRCGRIDAAVHSLKDLPVEDPAGLAIAAIPERASPLDVLVYDARYESDGARAAPLRAGSVVGTSSPRRRGAVLAAWPELRCDDLRGNVPTRVQKVRDGRYAAIVLAAAGLERLGWPLAGLSVRELPPDRFPPAPGQGALAVQCRAGDARVRALVAAVHDPATARCAQAERQLLQLLGGGCSMPLGVLAAPRPESGFRLHAGLFAAPRGGARASSVHIALDGEDLDVLVRRAAEELAPLAGDPLRGARVLLLRPDGDGGAFAAALMVAGADVTTAALTRTTPIAAQPRVLDGLPARCAVAFSSARAVERFFALARSEMAAGPVAFSFFAAGPATARAVQRRGHPCRAPVPADGAGGRALAALVRAAHAPADGPVLFPCALGRHPAFERELAAAGYAVRALPVYRTEAASGAGLPTDAFDFAVLTSPSAARALAAHGGARGARLLALGPTTAAQLERSGLAVAGVAAAPVPHAVVARLTEMMHAHQT